MARGGEVEAKPLAGSEPREGSQRIADDNGPSRCGEELDPLHPREPHRSKPDRFSRNLGRWRQETTDRTDTTSTIAFGPWVQTLLPQSTFETIGLVGQVDGPLGKGVFLTDFAQPQVSPSWATELPVLWQGKSSCGEATRRSSRLSSPLPRAIRFWRVLPGKEKRSRFCRWGPNFGAWSSTSDNDRCTNINDAFAFTHCWLRNRISVLSSIVQVLKLTPKGDTRYALKHCFYLQIGVCLEVKRNPQSYY